MTKLLFLAFVFALASQASAGPLHNAINSGDVTRVEALIASGEDVNQNDKSVGTPLHRAVIAGNTAVAKFLLASGANVNADNRGLGPPLHIAVRKGYEAVVALLLANGAGVDSRYRDGTTPLHVAADGGHAAIVGLLVAHGADVNARRPGRGEPDYDPPVHLAGTNGHFDVVELLRAYGAKGPPIEPVAELLASAEPGEGKQVSTEECSGCHAIERNASTFRRGPNLWGVVGRQKASLEGFKYSSAFGRLVGTRTLAELNDYLTSPTDYVPGTAMGIVGARANVRDKVQRANLIPFLRQESDDQVPLLWEVGVSIPRGYQTPVAYAEQLIAPTGAEPAEALIAARP